jgi:glucuronosyltransferase
LINHSYRSNATRLSNLLRDEMVPAKDAAVYWIEHVMRHGGAKHLQLSSRNLPFYQKHLLDVWLFLFAVVSFVTFLLYTSVRCILSFICKRRKVKTQ